MMMVGVRGGGDACRNDRMRSANDNNVDIDNDGDNYKKL